MRVLRVVVGVAAFTMLVSGCGTQPVDELSVGECFDFSEESVELSSVTIVDCANPHGGEVFATFDVVLEEFDAEAVAAAADEQCLVAFEPYFGFPYAAADYYYRAFTPAEDGWVRGARTVVCFIVPEEGTFTGSVKQSDA